MPPRGMPLFFAFGDCHLLLPRHPARLDWLGRRSHPGRRRASSAPARTTPALPRAPPRNDRGYARGYALSPLRGSSGRRDRPSTRRSERPSTRRSQCLHAAATSFPRTVRAFMVALDLRHGSHPAAGWAVLRLFPRGSNRGQPACRQAGPRRRDSPLDAAPAPRLCEARSRRANRAANGALLRGSPQSKEEAGDSLPAGRQVPGGGTVPKGEETAEEAAKEAWGSAVNSAAAIAAVQQALASGKASAGQIE